LLFFLCEMISVRAGSTEGDAVMGRFLGKRWLIGLLGLTMLIGTMPGHVAAADMMDGTTVSSVTAAVLDDEQEENSWRFQNGVQMYDADTGDDELMTATVTIADATAKGIDVSRWQGTIDWDRVRPQISFALLRCTRSDNYLDPTFAENASACERLGIPYGVYVYSYATSVADAEQEAEFLLSQLEGYHLALPVYYDLEDDSILKSCNNQKILQIAQTFCDAVEEAGYRAGVYANLNWWTNYLPSSKYDQWDRWVAQYNNTGCTYTGSFSFWQQSCTGKITGISEAVDIDYAVTPLFSNGKTPTVQNSGVTGDETVSGIVSCGTLLESIKLELVLGDGSILADKTVTVNGPSYDLSAIDWDVPADVFEKSAVKLTVKTADGTVTELYPEWMDHREVPTETAVTVQKHAEGLALSWEPIGEADHYVVARKTEQEDWELIAEVNEGAYLDTDVRSGVTYSYQITAMEGGIETTVLETGPVTYLAQPVVNIANCEDGVSLTWDAVAGGSVYHVLRQDSDGNWAPLETTEATSYVDAQVKSGQSYTYSVYASGVTGVGASSSYDPQGWSIQYLAAPTLKDIRGSSTGVTIQWEAVQGASQYRVYRKNADGTWNPVADTNKTSYTDRTTQVNHTYCYTVACISKEDTETLSVYSAEGLSIKPAETPVLTGVSNGASGVTIQWKAASGAVKYRVYRKEENGGWKKLSTITETSYTDTTAESGITYSYTVRCLSADQKRFTSDYDTTGLKILCIAAHDLSSVTNSADGVTVQWQASKGVKKYGVFRRTASTGWKRIETTDATSYTDTEAESGTTYYYTVRCLTSDGAVIGRYDTTGKKITHIAAPKLSSVSNGAKSVTIKWSASKGAKKYRVYRKTGSGSWERIGETTSTSYTDTTAKAGTTYTYTVRCITADGKSTTSGYDGTGKTIKRLTQPTPSVSKTSSGIKTSWSKVSGADKYYVYRKTASGSWSKIATTTSTSYTDKTAKKGTTYYYTVRAVSGNYLSSYTSSKAIKR
jgi:fibronectin type 3 domain-containing protein/GH25 family lysozyme M1 (1,4-beta-N-acetylmuramidase)